MSHCVRVTACLVALLLVALPGCSESEDAETTSATETSTEVEESITAPDTTDYEALIIQLQNTLLEERQNHYISEAEYRARLERLEAELQLLRNPTTPDSTAPETETETETETESHTETTRPADVPTGTVPDTGLEDTISFSYSIENGGVTIHEYLGGARAVVLPSTVNGYPVTAIADNAFKNSTVTSVVIPSTVKSIGWFAFYGCLSLTSITVPDSVDMIHYAAFDSCPALTVLCHRNSYTANYVQSFGIPYQFI